ncbi:MAG: hypothetical protein J6B37_01265 [Clostridia bacterium]|nr:hypothetical protein [Clostridia bacterium]
MAKKQMTPEEYKAKLEIKAAKSERFSKVFLSSVAVMLSLVIAFSVVSIAQTTMLTVGKGGAVSVGGNNVNGGNSSTPNGDNSFVDGGNDVTPDNGDNSGAVTPDNNGGQTQTPPVAQTNENQEILDMYKTAVANARTKSKSVIRVKDGAINYKGIVEAGGLSSTASTLMGMFMAKDEASIEVKNEAWDKAKLPNANALTLNGVQKISRQDKGNTYVITVVAKNATNPKANADGVGSVAGVIEESQITGAIGAVPGLSLSNIKIDYENVTAVATVDKATGNLVELKLNAPCVLGLDAKLAFITMNGAKVGIQVITEYKISY